MPSIIKYKKPRRINAVSVTLALLVAIAAYATYQYLPLYMMRHEAYRILQENGSKIAGRPGYYEQDGTARDDMRRKIQRQLKDIGISDPEMETWIEIEGKQVRLGVIYSAWVEWPFGIVEPQETEYEVEHDIVLN